MMAGMAGRYAAALFELAKDQRQIETVEADVKAFQALLGESEDLRRGESMSGGHVGTHLAPLARQQGAEGLEDVAHGV